MNTTGRTATVALLLLAVVAPGLAALGNCASRISSRGGEPLTGELMGQRSVTETRTHTVSSGANAKIASATYTHTMTRMVSYDVGVYRMSDGTTREVRCDTYKFVG